MDLFNSLSDPGKSHTPQHRRPPHDGAAQGRVLPERHDGQAPKTPHRQWQSDNAAARKFTTIKKTEGPGFTWKSNKGLKKESVQGFKGRGGIGSQL